jgi:hypothetical protein
LLAALKSDRDYLIGIDVVVETDCLLHIGMIASCTMPDIAMLRWIAYIKTVNPKLRHIKGKENPVANMLSRARFMNDEIMQDEDQERATTNYQRVDHVPIEPHNDLRVNTTFKEEEYEGEWLEIGKFLTTQIVIGQENISMSLERRHLDLFYMTDIYGSI